jgi:hypothetical protein
MVILTTRKVSSYRYPQHYPIILTWCREHPDKAPERLAHMMPLNVTEDGKIKWHPFSKAIIDEFGDNENVLSLYPQIWELLEPLVQAFHIT